MQNVSILRRNARYFLLPCCMVLIVACGETISSTNADVVTIDMRANTFDPATVTVEEGTRVCFVNNDEEARWPASNIHPTHHIYPEFDPARPLPTGETWCFDFDVRGMWKYHDHLFPELGGTVTVE